MTEFRHQESSARSTWPAVAYFADAERRLGLSAMRFRSTALFYEFIRFGCKQAWACLFGGAMVVLLLATHYGFPHDAALSRYDFLFLAALVIQATLLATKLETQEEAKVIFAYHVVGTIMEIFKTDVGSWIYPEAAIFRIGGVPLFSGFMYASIGSYIARCWRLFEFRFVRHPPLWKVSVLAAAIYANFFTHHFVPDARWVLFAASALLFGRTWICYRVWHNYRRMPLLLGLFLVALFIWFAENIGTFTATWIYPHQDVAWQRVSFGKLGSWFLLLIVSYAMVAALNRPLARGRFADAKDEEVMGDARAPGSRA